jgi:hypothetical protein
MGIAWPGHADEEALLVKFRNVRHLLLAGADFLVVPDSDER